MKEETWEDFALCKNAHPVNDFFDNYEGNPRLAKIIDEECLHCLVMQECYNAGTTEGRHGVWGGVYLVSGKPSERENAHKTPEVWKRIEEKLDSTE